ncbi:MAG TPA: sigma-54-dependent Fis family transcriptional regulator, partial [Syntrophobacteraceae bacterium]|nr:sigma-54-dependent Fis family transcriptional regulator [Syntrophobacteraceae bacterium]
MRILVVEDDQTLGSLLSEYLKMLQHETIDVVSTGSEAREVIVAGEAYDCAFVDLMLPDIHGLELLQILKEYQPTTPSVIMSGHPTSEYALQAMRGGASDFLTKPFSLQELALTVERLGKERRLRLENRTLRVEQQGWAGRFSGIIKS